jgi:hypothetical protein
MARQSGDDVYPQALVISLKKKQRKIIVYIQNAATDDSVVSISLKRMLSYLATDD